MKHYFNLFTVLKKLKECVGFFFFNNLIATNEKVYALLCVACGWENSVYTVLCWCVGFSSEGQLNILNK